MKRVLLWRNDAVSGQSTVEFVVVVAAFLAMVLGLGTLWHLDADGKLVEHAASSASHTLSASETGTWGDVLAY